LLHAGLEQLYTGLSQRSLQALQKEQSLLFVMSLNHTNIDNQGRRRQKIIVVSACISCWSLKESINKANPFAILGIPKDANMLAIKRAYRTLSMKYHPD
jgi:DnaJ-domain-containing protein 1